MKKNSTFFIGKQCAILFLSISFILSAKLVRAQPTSQTFTSSGTYTVPAGYTAVVTIEAWGAGAGGGSGAAERGGGGGGAYATITTTLAAGSYAVTIGTGGTVGNVGGNSSLTTLVVAAGGSSTTTTTGGVGGTTAASTGTTKFAGGNGGSAGSGGGTKGGGGGGGSATTSAVGGNGANGQNNPTNLGGAGGPGTGAGGRGADGGGTPDAVAGSTYGGGGGGRGSGGGTSKAGADGRVIVTVNGVLPVKLSNLKAFEKQTGVQINWSAYSEENLDKYQIERSANGSIFTVLGEITAHNSFAETTYGFFDANPLPGVNFYRLKMIDLDNKMGFSSIVKVNLNKSVKDISVYPNPVVSGYVSVQTSGLLKGDYTVKIFNNSGQQVYSLRVAHNGGAITQAIQLPQGTKPGVYSVQLDNDGSKVISKAFIVQ